MFLSVDIGGTKTLLALFSNHGLCLKRRRFPTLKNPNVYLSDLRENVKEKGIAHVCELCGVGEPTLNDIITELLKPGRDVRDSLPPPVLREDVMSMEDIKPDMILNGIVRNVIDFGAFVDIGVHQDGLVHISEISDRFIRHPSEVLSVNDHVKVRVLSVDLKKKRIGLSMKGIK